MKMKNITVKEIKKMLRKHNEKREINFFIDDSLNDYYIDEINTQPLGSNYLNIILKNKND